MSSIVERKYSTRIFQGSLTGDFSADTEVARLSDKSEPRQVIATAVATHAGQLGASESYDVPLPNDYTNASYLQVMVWSEAIVRVITTGPDHDSSTTLLYGSTAQPGVHSMVQKVSTLTIENTTAAEVEFWYALVQLPDISDEDNFRGISSTGAYNK